MMTRGERGVGSRALNLDSRWMYDPLYQQVALPHVKEPPSGTGQEDTCGPPAVSTRRKKRIIRIRVGKRNLTV